MSCRHVCSGHGRRQYCSLVSGGTQNSLRPRRQQRQLLLVHMAYKWWLKAAIRPRGMLLAARLRRSLPVCGVGRCICSESCREEAELHGGCVRRAGRCYRWPVRLTHAACQPGRTAVSRLLGCCHRPRLSSGINYDRQDKRNTLTLLKLPGWTRAGDR
jgi:hypothetical protein